MRLKQALFIVLLVCAVTVTPIWAAPLEDSERCWTIYSSQGEIILITGIEVQVGDQFLDEGNRLYTVVKVEGQRAVAEQTGQVDLRSFLRSLMTIDQDAIPVQARQGKIGIYHTHSWESYLPSDGTAERVGRGGIFDVGDAMAAGFQDAGLAVERSNNQERDYSTSRRTALDLLKAGSDMIIDVHRDTASASQDYHTLGGQTATQALLVVGRQNPNMAVIRDLAYQIKGAADANDPGLIRGIFMANGNYNQDLSPRAILIEFGSASSLKEAASRSAYALAGIIAKLLFPPAAPSAPATPGTTSQPSPTGAAGAAARRAVWQSFLAWSALILVMVGGFLLINEGSWQAMVERIRRFATEEFGDLIGRVKHK